MVDAREYHQRTNHTPRSVREGGGLPPLSTKPRPFKQYRDVPSVPLSSIRAPMQPALSAVATARADPLAGADQPRRERLDRETLATICYEAAGVVQRVTARDGRELFFRAASCTGNLHHVDLYLVCGDLEDIDAGLYHFDPRTFSLDVLREGDYRGALADAIGVERTDSSDPVTALGVADAPVTVVATSTWERNAWKYRERTYRHAFWDSGTILANLLATAHALDYRAEVVAGFADERVADLVGVDPAREGPIALAPIGTGQPAPEAPAVEPIDPAVVQPTDHPIDTEVISDAWSQSALDDGAATAQFRAQCREHGEAGTRAVEIGMRNATGERGPQSSSGDDAADGAPVGLDPVDAETASARPLHHTIQRRGSRREFAEAGPTRRAVGTVLDRALRGVPADWNGGRATDADAGVASGLTYNDVYVLATGVDGLDDGAYYVDFDGAQADGRGGDAPATDHGGAFVRVGDVDRETKTHLALDQSWAGDAHVNVYLLANVDAIVDALGNRGYRLAQLEAGVALGRLYLATYAHRDLGGTGLTFYDELVAERLAPAGPSHTPADQPPDAPAFASVSRTPTCLFAFGTSAR